MADVGKVLDRGVGVAVALEHHCLALILVEEDFVLERAAVPGPHDLHGLFRQALPFLEFAGMKFDPCDSFDLVHCCSLSKFPLSAGIDACVEKSEPAAISLHHRREYRRKRAQRPRPEWQAVAGGANDHRCSRNEIGETLQQTSA